MELFLVFIALMLMLLGIIGSFLPILPGPLTSWVGLLVLHFTDGIELSHTFLITTLAIAVFIYILDYIIPAIGTVKLAKSQVFEVSAVLVCLFVIIITLVGLT